MYNVINILIHLVGIGLIIFACIPSKQYRKEDLSIEKIAAFAAFILMGSWALLVGEVYNLRSMIALIW